MKKLIYTLGLLVLFTAFMSGCKKNKVSDNDTSAEFYIYNLATESPVANVPVYLIEDDGTGNSLKSTVIGSGRTDEDGRYRFTWKARTFGSIQYFFEADVQHLADSLGYTIDVVSSPSNSSSTIKKDEFTELEYTIVPQAEIRREWVNVNCYDENDSLIVLLEYPADTSYFVHGTTSFALTCNGNVEGSNDFSFEHGGQWIFHCTSRKNGVDSSFIDSMYYVPGEKNVHRIEY